MYATLKGSGCDAMLRMRGRVVRETPLFVSPNAHLARLSDRLRRLKESFGQLGQQPWPRPAMPCCATDAGPIRSDRQACLVRVSLNGAGRACLERAGRSQPADGRLRYVEAPCHVSLRFAIRKPLNRFLSLVGC
jgi:hypothetical protein